MTTIKNIQTLINQTFQNKTDLSCYLFGSYAKDMANEQSDVDILLFFDKEKYDYKQISKLKAFIKDEFGKRDIYCDPIYGYIQNINDDKASISLL